MLIRKELVDITFEVTLMADQLGGRGSLVDSHVILRLTVILTKQSYKKKKKKKKLGPFGIMV